METHRLLAVARIWCEGHEPRTEKAKASIDMRRK